MRRTIILSLGMGLMLWTSASADDGGGRQSAAPSTMPSSLRSLLRAQDITPDMFVAPTTQASIPDFFVLPSAGPTSQPSTRPATSGYSSQAVLLLKTLDDMSSRTRVPRIRRDANDQIVALMLDHEAATDENAAVLPDFSSLVRLRIPCAQRAIGVKGMRELQKLPNLEELEISGEYPRVTEDVASAIASIPKLQTLSLRFTELDPGASAVLARSRSLRTLKLWVRHLSDADVAGLAKSESIEELDVSSIEVTDECLAALAHMPRLKRLTMKDTKISAGGIAGAGFRDDVEVHGVSPR